MCVREEPGAGRGRGRGSDREGEGERESVWASVSEVPMGRGQCVPPDPRRSGVSAPPKEREFFIDNLLVRIHFIVEMIRWTGLAPRAFEFPFLGSLTFTFQNTLSNPALIPGRAAL